MAGATQSEKLVQEIRQHQFLDDLYKYFQDAVQKTTRASVEKTRTTFGRWLQNVQHFNSTEETMPYRLLPRNLAEDDSASRMELVRMLSTDLNLDNVGAEDVTSDVLNRVLEFLDDDHADETLPDVAIKYTENDIGGQIAVGDFKTRFCPRVRYLAQAFGNDETALMCLRYDSLNKFRGGESGMCVTGLNALHDVGQVTFEGFSSPLNCRLLGREGVRFCSLFDDTDAAFGSLGNFFRIELTDYPGGWSLGPPFVEPVLNATADRVLATLDDTKPGEFWFFVTFPHWDDNPGWRRLEESPRKVARIDFDREAFWQQDNYGKIFRPDVRICIFVLGQLPDEVDLIELRNRIVDVDEARVRADWLKACDVAD